MSIEMIANYAEVIGAFTLVTAVIFGVSQIRMQSAQQANLIATQLTQTFMDESLALAISKVRQIPEGASAADIRAMGSEFENAAIRVTMSFETMGLLVYRGFAERELALDLAGGIMGVTWRKLYHWQMALREEQQQPSWAEWYEWLAEQSYSVKGTMPVHQTLAKAGENYFLGSGVDRVHMLPPSLGKVSTSNESSKLYCDGRAG